MKKNLTGRLLSYLRPYFSLFAAGQLFMLISLGGSVALPLLIKDLLDFSRPLPKSLAVLAVITLISGLAGYFRELFLGRVSHAIIVDLRTGLFSKLQDKSLTFYHNSNSGSIVSSMTNDINLFQQALSTGITWILQMMLSFLAVVAILFSMDLMLTLVILASFLLIMAVTKLLGKPVKSVSRQAQEELSRVTGSLNQSVNGISVIKSFTLEDFASSLFRSQNEKWYSLMKRQLNIKARSSLFIHYLNMGQIILIMGLGAWKISRGDMTLGALTAFVMYVQSLASPLGMLSQLYVDIQRALSAAERIFRLMDGEEGISEPEAGDSLPHPEGQIRFRHVAFSYKRKEKVLDDVDFTVPPGATAAFVGSSGAGKSTIMNLIPRFYDVSSGSIEFDGKDIRRLSKKRLRSLIALVPQSTYLFDMSIRDNIACGKVDATTGEIVEAAKKANAHDFIMAMPDGYETKTGEGGALLSGGQKQRLAIARAFLKDASLLLLDEATSALDNVSEKLVQDAVDKLMRGRTTLIVAHRLSTIMDADIIFVMDRGRIVGRGTHRDLLDSNRVYRKIYRASLSKTEKDRSTA